MLTLTSAQRRFLRANAHALNPVVMIGDAGLTESVMREIDLGLKSHELIKIKVDGDDRKLREEWLAKISNDLNAASVQPIGKTLVIYRPAEKPKLALPKS